MCGIGALNIYFLQHVTSEGIALVKQAEDAASNKKVLDLFLSLGVLSTLEVANGQKNGGKP
jgi:hypothetical protein